MPTLSHLRHAPSQWEEGFTGGSTLFGAGDDFLMRRSGYIAMPAADGIWTMGEGSGADGFPPPWRHGHATWSSRVNDRAEITLRFLRGGDMVVQRHLLLFGGGGELLSTATSEETFVRAGVVGAL